MPVARQLFKAEDPTCPVCSNPHSFLQQSLQLGSGVSRLEEDLAQLSLADPQSPEPSNRDPRSSTLSSLPSSPRSLEGNFIEPVSDLSSPEGSSPSEVAEQPPERTEAKDSLAFEPNGNSPALTAGQAANAEAPDAKVADAEATDDEADFLHTLFSCPITKVGCALCLPLLIQLAMPWLAVCPLQHHLSSWHAGIDGGANDCSRRAYLRKVCNRDLASAA